jgi:tetratricopeptide (TPR) repeat protein
MYFLWLCGSVVEDAIGWGRYLLIYFAGGIAAALTHSIITALSSPDAMDIPLVGASGAVAAVMAIAAIRFSRARVRFGYWVLIIKFGSFALPWLIVPGLWALQEVYFGIVSLRFPSGTAHWAHIGGLAFGIVAALTFGFLKDAADDYLSEEARGLAAEGRVESAAEKYGELTERQPDNPDFIVQKLQASMMARSGDATADARDLGKAIELLGRAGRTQEAIDAYKLLAQGPYRVLPVDAATQLRVASMAESQRDYLTALRIYNSLATQMAGSPAAEKAAFRVPHVLLTQGKVEDARTWWAYFRTNYPSSEWVQHADPAFRAE